MLKNLEIAQDKPDAAEVQCRGRSDRSGSSSALSFPLSLISSLQLDELELELEDELEELELEDELEELELDDHLEGSLLLLEWRGEPQTPHYRSNTAAFAKVPTPSCVNHHVHVC
jgi:hypothetical protein